MTSLRQRSADILWPHLRSLPAFRALIRGMEARLFLELGELPGPVLDLGCGDGHFAEAVFGHVDAGIDLEAVSVFEARERAVYGTLCAASATQMPFENETFRTVFSNCVIEHIPDIEGVFSEAARVLKPGGRFIYSVPTDRLNEQLFGTRFLNSFGASGLAAHYKQWFTRMQVHFHMYSRAKWRRLAENVGLAIVQETGYMSARATRLFDLGHVYGVPNLLSRRLTGQWVLFPWRPRFALDEAVMAPLVAEQDPPDASCCFFVAEKQ